ncbi:unnamed protein product [Arabis nemorensis]|uniref:Uncharacterized protein n=1 Tax=Arabis nemorensis TaxID=586526 RepID=A0A565CFX8_9BRAS|nr:unnamed protein product [Arabis nemorensis]
MEGAMSSQEVSDDEDDSKMIDRDTRASSSSASLSLRLLPFLKEMARSNIP